MNRTDHLLWIVAEECAEVAQRASKAARFGLNLVEPGHYRTNKERLEGEWNDLMAAMVTVGTECGFKFHAQPELIAAKLEKIEKFLAYSQKCGRLD